MTKPMLLADFERLSPAIRTDVVEGLAAAIDTVAMQAADSHRFLRYGWYAAALAAYGGRAKTLIVAEDDTPVMAMPFVPLGPRLFRLATVPGCYWPFRSFDLGVGVSDAALKAALAVLAGQMNGLRIGPVHDGDPAVTPLVIAARSAGWSVIDRPVGTSAMLDLAPVQDGQAWPRTSTLRKNRYHEKHLASHGPLEWSFLQGEDWPRHFDMLGGIEGKSWIAVDTDRADMKFTREGHLAFWQAAAIDPVLAGMFRAAVLRVGDAPAAFSFDIDTGHRIYAIANSYDPHFAKHSPGKLLQWRNLVAAMDRGAQQVDWGAGDSGYKQVIGARDGTVLRDWLFLRPGMPAVAGRLLRHTWRRSGHRNDS